MAGLKNQPYPLLSSNLIQISEFSEQFYCFQVIRFSCLNFVIEKSEMEKISVTPDIGPSPFLLFVPTDALVFGERTPTRELIHTILTWRANP